MISNWEWLEQKLAGVWARRGMEFIAVSRESEPTVLDGSRRIREIRSQIGTPICFEATVPGVCRSLVFQNGSDRRARMCW